MNTNTFEVQNSLLMAQAHMAMEMSEHAVPSSSINPLHDAYQALSEVIHEGIETNPYLDAMLRGLPIDSASSAAAALISNALGIDEDEDEDEDDPCPDGHEWHVSATHAEDGAETIECRKCGFAKTVFFG